MLDVRCIRDSANVLIDHATSALQKSLKSKDEGCVSISRVVPVPAKEVTECSLDSTSLSTIYFGVKFVTAARANGYNAWSDKNDTRETRKEII